MLNKRNNVSNIRLVIQILFLIFMPGLFTLIFGQLKQIYTYIINGNFEINKILPLSMELLILIPLTMIFGRFFCGYFCAFGTINDILYKLSSKVLNIRFQINKKADKYLRLIKYIVLLFCIIFIWTLGYSGLNDLNPWNAFAQIIQLPPSVPSIAGLSVLILILIGALLIERFFCRYLCPLGAFLSILQVLRIFRINKNKSTCLEGCSICTRNCPMGIELNKVNRVDSIDCIQCMNCTKDCTKNNIKLSIASKAINGVAVLLIFIFIFITFKGLAGQINYINPSVDSVKIEEPNEIKTENKEFVPNEKVNGFRGNDHGEHGIAKVESIQVTEGEYKDGTYTGTANGFKPGLTVQVTISGGKITKIDIVDHNETPSYARMPMQLIPNEIINNQSTNVDTVSGATRTSVGIINAVADALKQAKK